MTINQDTLHQANTNEQQAQTSLLHQDRVAQVMESWPLTLGPGSAHTTLAGPDQVIISGQF